jgi:hypothetical protein
MCDMFGIDEHPVWGGSRRVLMQGTVVMAAAAALVLTLGTQDARLLRLGIVAALWAALLGAFATVRVRGEVSSRTEHADQLRAAYQRELEREVAARREHALAVERELREQAELAQRREIVELRTELAAMRANLEQLLGRNPLVERVAAQAEPARLLPLPAHSRTFDDSRSRAAVAPVAATAEPTVTAAHSLTGPERRFGPGRAYPSTWAPAVSPNGTGTSTGHGRHGVPGEASSTSPAAAQAQRTVSDLLSAHGVSSAPRRRHNHEDRPATSA